jgi:hypothetical protein
MKKKLITLSGLVLSFAPVVAFAQFATGTGTSSCGTSGVVGTIDGLLCKIGSLLTAVIPVMVAVGVVYFVWGVVSYVIADDEEAKSAGRARMLWGIVGLAVIIAVWGLVGILVRTFVPDGNTGNITLPTVRF